MSYGNNAFYAPKPQAPSYLYPPPDAAPGYASSRPSPSPSPIPSAYKESGASVDYRAVNRTPSPTPSEAAVLSGQKQRACGNLRKYFDPEWLKNPRNLITLIITVIVIALTITFVVLQDKIIHALEPAADWLKTTPGAWAIPIGVMIVLSFPPLFGHELVALFCGDVWGPWIGFGIVAAGTVLGELCTFFVFKYLCKGRAEKLKTKNLRYALLSAVISEGGLIIAIMVRFSAIPGHLTTAIFASVGMNVFTFLIAALVSSPKQLAAVYLGSAEYSQANADSSSAKHVKLIKYIVIGITIAMTLIAMRFINARTELVKERVIYQRRKARQAAQFGTNAASHNRSVSGVSTLGGPGADEDSVPLVSHYAQPSEATLAADDGGARYAALKSPPQASHGDAYAARRYDDPYDA